MNQIEAPGPEVLAPRPRAGLSLVAPERRIRAAVSSLLALMILGVLLGTFLIVRLGSEASALADREVRYATALSAVALNAKGIANDERGFLLSGNDQFLIQMDIRTDEARLAFDLAAEAADEASRRRILEAKEIFERWLVAVDEEVDMFRAGDRETAMATSLGPTRQLRKDYEALIATASLIEGVPTTSAAVSASAAWSVAILLAYLAGAAAIGLAVSVWVVGGMRREEAA